MDTQGVIYRIGVEKEIFVISRKYLGLIMNFWFSLIIGISVSLLMIYVNTGTLSLGAAVISSLEAFVLSFLSGMIIPMNKIGAKFQELFHAKEGGILFHLLNTLVICVIICLILSGVFTVINVGFTGIFFLAWISSFLIALITSYIIALSTNCIILKISMAMTKEEWELY